MIEDEHARYLLHRGKELSGADPTLGGKYSLVPDVVELWHAVGWMAEKMGLLEERDDR